MLIWDGFQVVLRKTMKTVHEFSPDKDGETHWFDSRSISIWPLSRFYLTISSILHSVPQTRADEEHIAITYKPWQSSPETNVRNHICPRWPVYCLLVKDSWRRIIIKLQVLNDDDKPFHSKNRRLHVIRHVFQCRLEASCNRVLMFCFLLLRMKFRG